MAQTSVQRYKKRYIETGNTSQNVPNGGRKRNLSNEDEDKLKLIVLSNPTIYIKEMLQIMKSESIIGNFFSEKTLICRELKRIKFSRKKIKYISQKRDEDSRVRL